MNRRGFIKALAAAAVAPAVLGTTRYFDIGASRRVEERARMRAVGLWSGAAGDFKKGDIITISGSFAYNPITGERTEHLQKFEVTADVQSDHSVELHPHPMVVGPAYRQLQRRFPSVGL